MIPISLLRLFPSLLNPNIPFSLFSIYEVPELILSMGVREFILIREPTVQLELS